MINLVYKGAWMYEWECGMSANWFTEDVKDLQTNLVSEMCKKLFLIRDKNRFWEDPKPHTIGFGGTSNPLELIDIYNP